MILMFLDAAFRLIHRDFEVDCFGQSGWMIATCNANALQIALFNIETLQFAP